MRFFIEALAPRESDVAVSHRGSCQRPPWTSETRIREHCTSCGDCLKACPEGILVAGPAGTPTVDFSIGACTFCAACADVCGEDVFHSTDQHPWTIKAHISPSCFLDEGIACRSCADACETDALAFDLRAGSVGLMRIVEDNCTGCGACVGSCPADAIVIGAPRVMETEA